MKKLIVKWEVEDGYVGASRPQKSTIDLEDHFDSEEAWNALSMEQKREFIDEIVHEHFQNRISFEINDYGI